MEVGVRGLEMHTSVASPLVQRAAADEEGKGKGSGEKPRGFGFAAVAFHPFFPPCPCASVFLWFSFLFYFFVRKYCCRFAYSVREPRVEESVKKKLTYRRRC